MSRLAFYTDPLFVRHDPGEGHPESPARLQAVLDHLQETGFLERVQRPRFGPATREHLLLVHTERYVDFALGMRGRGPALMDGAETVINADSIDAALLAAGAAVDAVDRVCRGEFDRAFCALRPPGHHARPDAAMGFCVFNHIALAAAHALAAHDIQRVLVVDWDVHHGNGTQEAFYDSDRVFVLNIHQAPFFPGTGTDGEKGIGAGIGFTRNHPTLARKRDDYYTALLDRALTEIERTFRPDLVLISAGFDAHVDDPIGGMKLTEAGFETMTDRVVALAGRHAGGRIVSFLEGRVRPAGAGALDPRTPATTARRLAPAGPS